MIGKRQWRLEVGPADLHRQRHIRSQALGKLLLQSGPHLSKVRRRLRQGSRHKIDADVVRRAKLTPSGIPLAKRLIQLEKYAKVTIPAAGIQYSLAALHRRRFCADCLGAGGGEL